MTGYVSWLRKRVGSAPVQLNFAAACVVAEGKVLLQLRAEVDEWGLEVRSQRSQGQGQIAAVLERNGSLRHGRPEQEAADIIHALMSPEVYGLLVVDRGWSDEQYEDWLAATLVRQLL